MRTFIALVPFPASLFREGDRVTESGPVGLNLGSSPLVYCQAPACMYRNGSARIVNLKSVLTLVVHFFMVLKINKLIQEHQFPRTLEYQFPRTLDPTHHHP